MPKVGDYPIPSSYIEKAIVRLALAEGRKLVAQGRSPEEAATLVCKRAWLEWREYVLTQLQDG